MSLSRFQKNLVDTLLYYDIFNHPLTLRELFYLFPQNSMTKSEFLSLVNESATAGLIVERNGFILLRKRENGQSETRAQREVMARRRMRTARRMAWLIKQFPFVRGIFLSGDLSKGVSTPSSDIDYVIVTESGRLWICRMILMLFKKTILLNKRTYFCLNYYVSTKKLELTEDRNYFTATEIAHLKPLYNLRMFIMYMNANAWIKNFFPNYRGFALLTSTVDSAPSLLQKVLEFPFRWRVADGLDAAAMKFMERVWQRRYPQLSPDDRSRLFRCTPDESRAYAGNFSDKIMKLYDEKLRAYDLE